MPEEKRPFFRRVSTWITAAAAFLAALVTLTGAAGELWTFIKSLIPSPPPAAKCSEFKISSMSVVPYYLINTIERGGNSFLYWVALGGRNSCKDDYIVEVELTITNPSLATSEKPKYVRRFPHQEAPGSMIYEAFNPKLSFLNENINAPISIEWAITRSGSTAEKIACDEWGEPINIMVAPNKHVYWDLKKNDGTDVDKNFILASLSAWTLDAKINNSQEIQGLLSGPRPNPDITEDKLYLQWFNDCYLQLFAPSNNQVVVRPYYRPWPPEGKGSASVQILRSPKEIIESKQANPIEAALLMGALKDSSKNINPELRLALFALPNPSNSPEGKKRFLIGWSCNESNWHALDMSRLNQSGFDENESEATRELHKILKDNITILSNLNEKGTYIDDQKGILILEFDRASEINRIGSLRLEP